MFALRFRFLAGRYHATPWGRNVNEADVAWPPEPWRLLRALIAAYWRKGDHKRWPEEALGRLIDALAETPPAYRLPEGAIHAHTRHYMPQARGNPKLIFDAFVRIPEQGTIVAAWSGATLDAELFALGADLAAAVGYLGRAESWTECEALADWHDEPNCGPMEAGFSGDAVRILAPLSPAAYAAERNRLIAEERRRIASVAKKTPSEKSLETLTVKAFQSKASEADTLPASLVDALTLDTADWQDRGWPRPPAAREVLYARGEKAAVGVIPRVPSRRRLRAHSDSNAPTVARFLLAGRPRPRVEDAVRIGELMRLAALSQFGWRHDDASGRQSAKGAVADFWSWGRRQAAPGSVAPPRLLAPGRRGLGRLDRPRLSLRRWRNQPRHSRQARSHHASLAGTETTSGRWRHRGRKRKGVAAGPLKALASQPTLPAAHPSSGRSLRWWSATPFLAAGHLKAGGYAAEFQRLVKRTGMDRRFGFNADEIKISEHRKIAPSGTARRVLHFQRFRSRGREAQHDTTGVFLEVVFPVPVDGPIALGYGSHFGLGLFTCG